MVEVYTYMCHNVVSDLRRKGYPHAPPIQYHGNTSLDTLIFCNVLHVPLPHHLLHHCYA